MDPGGVAAQGVALVWVVVAILAVFLVLNLITHSGGERALWAPVSAVLLVCSLVVALGKPTQDRMGSPG